MTPEGLIWRTEWYGQRAVLLSAGLDHARFDDKRRIHRLSLVRLPECRVSQDSAKHVPAHFIIPGRPSVHEGRFEVYRLYRDGAVLDDQDNVLVALTGPLVGTVGEACFTELVTAYLSTRYDLSDDAIGAALEAFPEPDCR